MDGDQRRYRAFISYSQKDKGHARRVHQALEAFHVPRGVEAPGLTAKVRKLGRFFRDDEEMGAASDLGDALRSAIAGSESLIVICSPNAARSVWVDREIAHFKRTGRADKVFALIVAGEANVSASSDPKRRESECFPPALRFEVEPDGSVSSRPQEPLGIDVRKEAPERTTARLAAGLLGVPFDDLWRRAKRRAQRQAMTVASVMAVVVAGAVGVFFWVNGTLSTTAASATSARKSADSAQLARMAERAEVALAAAEALSDARGAGLDPETAEERTAQSEARWKAAALVYATALAGGEEQARPLYARLGYVRAATYFDNEKLTPGDLLPGKSWTYVVSLDPPISTLPDGKPTRIGKLFPTAGGAAIDFPAAMIEDAATSPSRRWMALAAEDFEEDDDEPVDGSRELTEEEFEALMTDASTVARVDIWDLDTGKVAWSVKSTLPDFQMPKPAFSPKEDVLALARTGGIQLIDMATHKPVADFPYKPDARFDTDEWVKWVAFSRDDTRIHILLSNLWLMTLDLPSKTWLRPVKTQPGSTSALSDLPSARRINPGPDKAHVVLTRESRNAAGDSMTSAYMLNVETGAVDMSLEPGCPRGSQYCTLELLEFQQDGKSVVVKDDKGTRLVSLVGAHPPVDLLPDSCLTGPIADERCATAVALAPHAPMIAIGHVRGEVRLIDAATGKELRTLTSAPGDVGYLAFTPDGSRLVGLASTSFNRSDGLILIWDTETGAVLSRSGLANKTTGEIEAVEAGGRRLLVTDQMGFGIWHSLGPVNETAEEGLRRLCAVRGAVGLVLGDDDRMALPPSVPAEPDLCKWPRVLASPANAVPAAAGQ